jgi:hypothetical protein
MALSTKLNSASQSVKVIYLKVTSRVRPFSPLMSAYTLCHLLAQLNAGLEKFEAIEDTDGAKFNMEIYRAMARFDAGSQGVRNNSGS